MMIEREKRVSGYPAWIRLLLFVHHTVTGSERGFSVLLLPSKVVVAVSFTTSQRSLATATTGLSPNFFVESGDGDSVGHWDCLSVTCTRP